MARRVVCISRTLGAGGEEIAHDVAASLGFRLIDDEILALAAEKAGVSAEQVAKAEHSQPLVARILESLANAPAMSEGGYVAPTVTINYAVSYSHLIEHVIRETAEAGDVVIVAHGASHPLAGRADVLRVLITASLDARVERPAKYSQKLTALISEICLDAYNIFDCHDYARIEVRVDKGGNPYIIEINPNPSINRGDCVPNCAEMVGFPYDDLNGWRAIYPPEIFVQQFEKVAEAG